MTSSSSLKRRGGFVFGKHEAVNGEGEHRNGGRTGSDARGVSAENKVGLNEAERVAIELMRNLADVVGLPPSVAEIYGLLFVAPHPVCMDELVERLGISQGSASQGLRVLLRLGAVESVALAGERRSFFRAETRLKVLLPAFLENQVRPRLEAWPERIAALEAAAAELDDEAREVTLNRVTQLRGWMRKMRTLMPALVSLLKAQR